jgi:L-histidine N-alpha-methyltransferase
VVISKLTESCIQTGFRRALAEDNATVISKAPAEESLAEFATSIADGLSSSPKFIESRFLYDAEGSALYESITRQPEYYLTRTEAAILADNVKRARQLTGPVNLVELGSGNSEKTELLLGSWNTGSGPIIYMPVDISENALSTACRGLASRHPSVQIFGLHADYSAVFPVLREVSPVMVMFLGSTIGNFDDTQMSGFLRSLSSALLPGDFFLVGVDLVKEPAVIEAAYNDAAGATAGFVLNLFSRINRELGSKIDISELEYVGRYDPEREQVELAIRFARSQRIQISPLRREFEIQAGETIGIEISRKFRLERFVPYLETFGFVLRESFSDPLNWFAVALMEKRTETGIN